MCKEREHVETGEGLGHTDWIITHLYLPFPFHPAILCMMWETVKLRVRYLADALIQKKLLTTCRDRESNMGRQITKC